MNSSGIAPPSVQLRNPYGTFITDQLTKANALAKHYANIQRTREPTTRHSKAHHTHITTKLQSLLAQPTSTTSTPPDHQSMPDPFTISTLPLSELQTGIAKPFSLREFTSALKKVRKS